MTARKPLPRLSKFAYRTDELLSLGITPGRLRANDLKRVTRGVYVSASNELDSIVDRCRAFLPALAPGQFFSRRTAAELYGLPVDRCDLLDIGAFFPSRAPKRAEVHGHRMRTGTVAIEEFSRLPVASPADTWCLLAAVLPHEDLVIAGDALLTGRRRIGSGGSRFAPLATLDDLAVTSERHRGTTGTRARARALPLLRWPVDSPAETRLRLTLRGAGLAEPRVNCPVVVSGRTLHADLGYPEQKVAVEYDGLYHFIGGEEQARRDVERWELMTDAGWRVLRATARDLRLPQPFLLRLARALHADT